MKKFLLLLCTLLGTVGAWADVTVTLVDGGSTNQPYDYYGSRNNSVTPNTFTTNANSGLAGLVLTAPIIDRAQWWSTQCLAIKTSAVQTDEYMTLTAPEGYLITGLSMTAQSCAGARPYKITVGDDTQNTLSSTTAHTFTQSGLSHKSVSITIQQTSTTAEFFGIKAFTVTLVPINFVSLTFDRSGSGASDVTVNVKNKVGATIQGVTATLESTSITEYKTGSASALSRTTNSVLAPNAGYDNQQNSAITYTFKVEGLAGATFNKAALDIYALTGGGAAQGNTGNTIRKWTFDVATGSTENDLTTFVNQEDNDICTVSNEDGGLYHNLWTMSGSNMTATNTLYVKVTLTKTDALGCFAGLGEVRLFKPAATVQYVISDASGVIYTSDPMGGTAGETITELPSSLQRPYCTYSVTSTTIESGENTVPVTVTYAPPFTVSSDFASATWYYATLRGKQLRADESAKDGSGRYQTNTTNERTDVYKWAFVGNPYNLSIINKGAGDSKCLYMGTQPVMQAATPASDNKARWVVSANSNGGFTVRSESGATMYINDAGNGGNLGYWNSSNGANDGGGNWVISEVSASDKAALGDAITAALALVNGAGVPGYINSTAAATLNSAISTAQGVYDDPSGDYVSAYNTLAAAITAASVPANINYTPRTDVYYTIVNARGAMVYDPSHSSSVDTQNDNAEYIWYGSTTPDATDPNNLWGFIERDGNYYMYNVGKLQFASVGHGTYGNTWIFSNTPAYITLDDGIADEIVPPGVRVRATIATTGSSYTMSVSTNYTGPVITYDYNGDGGVPMVFAESSYSVSSEVTSAIEALIEDVTPYRNALKAVIDGCASIIGDGVNKYASNDTYTDALAAANTAYNNASATKSELQTAKSNLENAIAGLSINLPGTGFYRIKGATSEKYLAAGVASNSKFAMTNAEDATTIFYFADSKLLNYSTGFYSGLVSGDGAGGWTWAIGAENASTTTFKDGHTQGGYAIQSADVYLYDNGDGTNSADRGGASGINLTTSNVRYRSWKLTEVTSLPVTISSALYATLYTPVALTIPSGVKAYYISSLTATEATLAEIQTTIPANTPVILAGQAGTYDFAITTSEAFSDTNKLAGSIAAFAVSAEDVENKVYYTLQKNVAGTAVGLFPKTAAGSIAGFKAYLPAANFPATQSVKGFTFIFDNGTETGINTIHDGQVIMNGDAIFNIAGQRMNKLQRGVNIVNGKKVLVK